MTTPAERDARRLARLRAMQRLALALLAAMAVLFVLAHALRGRHPAWGWVAAFAEAAMVGALADWFAVVALFRHPLGLPIWHTAIVPQRKDDIARNLGDFVASHFVTAEAVVTRMRAFAPAQRAARWLAVPEHAAGVGRWSAAALRQALAALDDGPLREAARERALAALEGIDALPLAGAWAQALADEGRHQQALDWALQRTTAWLESDAAQPAIAEVLDSVDHVLISALSGRIAAIVRSGSLRLCRAALADPAHVLRQRLDAWVAQGLQRLGDDPGWAARVRQWQHELVRGPRLHAAFDAAWDDLRRALLDDLGAQAPRLGGGLAQLLQRAAQALAQDERACAGLDESLCRAVTPLVQRHRGEVAGYIRAQIDAWSREEMTHRIELAIGRDLQFIRINGTVVGGLAGLLLHALVQWWG